MDNENRKKRKNRKSCYRNNEIRILGLILFSFGAITICTFILPLKALIVLFSIILLMCGVLLFLWQ